MGGSSATPRGVTRSCGTKLPPILTTDGSGRTENRLLLGRSGGRNQPGTLGPASFGTFQLRIGKRRAGVAAGKLEDLFQGRHGCDALLLGKLEEVACLQQPGHIYRGGPGAAEHADVSRDRVRQDLLGVDDVAEADAVRLLVVPFVDAAVGPHL